jgi:hypothetical protein
MQKMEGFMTSVNSDVTSMYQIYKLGDLLRPRLSMNVSRFPRSTAHARWIFKYFQNVNKFVESIYLENSKKSGFWLKRKCRVLKINGRFCSKGSSLWAVAARGDKN